MYSADKPIESGNDDILGRRPFSKQLARAILSIDKTDSVTIGLYGKWGTGKTSIINMAVEEIKSLANNMTEDSRPIVIKFEPWNFVDADNLISQFFKYLQSELKPNKKGERLENVGEALEEYSEAIEFAEAIPVVGKYASLLKHTMSFAGKRLMNKTTRYSVLSAKEKLSVALTKQKKKVLIIIDDIDRLSNNQIRMIFQLVSSVAGLPNLLYLLSMDKEIVVRALESVQECDGNEYLEKIIQIPFEIPAIDSEKVLKLLHSKLDEILNSKTNTIFNKEHWSKILRTCIEPYISNVRDVNRVVNTFQFRYDMMYSEVDFADLFGVTILQVMEPEIIKWILSNRLVLCGSSYDYKGVVMAEQQIKKQKYLDEFQAITKNSANMLNVLCAFFPKFAKEVEYPYELITDDELRRQSRLAHVDKFYLYFELNLDKIPISKTIIQNSITKYSYKEMKELLDLVNNEGAITSYLQELRSSLQDIPYERIPVIVEVLWDNSYWFTGFVEKSIFPISAQILAEGCIRKLIKRLNTEEEKYDLYKRTIENANLLILHTISEYINIIELGFGRLAGKEEIVDKQIISLEHLIILENLYVERLKKILTNESLFELDSLLFVIYLWKNYDEVGCKEYIEKLLTDKINILKFIVRLSTSWTGTEGNGWTFEEKHYKEFVTTESVLKSIEETTYAEKKTALKEKELLKLASFVLNRNLAPMESVSEDEAKDLVNQWVVK